MSTHASISIKNTNGIYLGIYLHWDGTIDECGRKLKENFNTFEKAKALVDLGDLSELGTDLTLESKTKAYIRDVGNTECDHIAYDATSYKDILEFFEDCKYHYLFEDGKWYVTILEKVEL